MVLLSTNLESGLCKFGIDLGNLKFFICIAEKQNIFMKANKMRANIVFDLIFSFHYIVTPLSIHFFFYSA